jgi:hypothetical protein
VARQPARQQEDRIDPYVVAVAGKAWCEPLGGHRDPPQPVMIEGHSGTFLATPRLHLDERHYSTASGDQVDFTAGHARTLGQDPPAMQPQPPGRQPLGAAAALLGNDSPVQRLSSSARA